MGEWLSQQFAKLSFRNGRKGSNPLLSASVMCECGGMVYTTDLKSVAFGIESSSLSTRTSFCGDRIMDNTVGFYPTNEGSIPSCRTNCWACSLMVKQSTHNRLSLSSILSEPTKLCRWNQLDRYWIANPWKQVRFLSPTPDNHTCKMVNQISLDFYS